MVSGVVCSSMAWLAVSLLAFMGTPKSSLRLAAAMQGRLEAYRRAGPFDCVIVLGSLEEASSAVAVGVPESIVWNGLIWKRADVFSESTVLSGQVTHAQNIPRETSASAECCCICNMLIHVVTSYHILLATDGEVLGRSKSCSPNLCLPTFVALVCFSHFWSYNSSTHCILWLYSWGELSSRNLASVR